MNGTMLLDEPTDVLEDVTAEELAALRRIRERQKAQQHTPYRRALLARVAARTAKLAEAVPLPGGGYQTYRLTRGTHRRNDLADVEAARAQTQAMKKEHGAAGPVISPDPHVFRPGDLVTPETDGEALLIDQDPTKFAPVGPAAGADGMDALLAENARLKAQGDRAGDLDAREKELARREAELGKGGGSKKN